MNLKPITIHLRIKDLRKDQLLTQEALADTLGISRQSIIALESGKYLPSLPLAMQMAEVFSLTISELIAEDSSQIAENSSQNIEQDQHAISDCISWPRVNLKKVENVLVMQANLAGYNEKEIDVEVGNYKVQIKGKIKPDVDLPTYYLREITAASFDRVVNLPLTVIPSRSTANFENGILTVKMPILKHKVRKLKVN